MEPHMHAWDCLGGLLMIREAGGRTAPFPQADALADGGRVVGAAPGAWDDIAQLMGDGVIGGA
jgi:myo-inositol-1(or 4)-monophosphatase